MDGDAGWMVVLQLAFTGVHADPQVQAKLADRVVDRASGLDRARRSVEGSEESVPCRVSFLAAEARELATHARVVAFEKLTPTPITELRRTFGRADNVRKENRREDAVDGRRRTECSDEAPRFLEERVVRARTHPAEDIAESLDLDRLGARNVRGDVRRLLAVFRPVPDEGWRPNRREHLAHVPFHHHPQERDRRTWTPAAPHVPDEPVLEVAVACDRRVQTARSLDEVRAISPTLASPAQLPTPVVLGRSPRIIRRPD